MPLTLWVTLAFATFPLARAVGGSCFNSSTNPTCWDVDFNITTDYHTKIPEGKEVPVWLELSEITLAPDGVSRTVIAFNGSIPGPKIEANWGDTIGKS
jgi:hypothetical protein